jgi:hypothetical protein
MQDQERDRIAAFLDGAASSGSNPRDVASLVVTTLSDIDQALSPIVGHRGMAALYRRSLHLVRPAHPWLPVAADGGEPKVDVAPLAAALGKRTAGEAAAAGTELLESLRTLLNTLIGESLTARLLRPVWATLLSAPSARKATS